MKNIWPKLVHKHDCIFIAFLIFSGAKKNQIWIFFFCAGQNNSEESVPLPTELPSTAAQFFYHRGCKQIGLQGQVEVGVGLCSPIPTITKLYDSVLASILCPPNFVIVI